MKKERERLEAEKKRILEEEAQLLKEKGSWKQETDSIRQELESVKKDRNQLIDGIDKKIDDKLAGFDGNPHKNALGQFLVELPAPIRESVNYSKDISGDEEYWL